MSIASASTNSTPPNKGKNRPVDGEVAFFLQEAADVSKVDRILNSPAMIRLKADPASKDDWQKYSSTLELVRSLKGALPVRYVRSTSGFGRFRAEVTVSGSRALPFCQLKRQIRAHLAAARHWDVDMVNCQPAILAQVFARYMIPCPLLSRYVTQREACLDEVQTACGVSRGSAKKLFVRLLFFGTVRGWAVEEGLNSTRVAMLPSWVNSFMAELDTASKHLLQQPEMTELKLYFHTRYAMENTPFGDGRANASGNALGSIMAMYLQTCERRCIEAVIEAATLYDNRILGSIIHDGIHIVREDGETALPPTLLRRWEDHVAVKTGFRIQLSTKPFELDPDWLGPEQPTVDVWDDTWLDGDNMLSYAEMKELWERRSFKVVKAALFVRKERDSHDVVTEKHLNESYKHLHYTEITGDHGSSKVTRHGFISKWLHDPTIRRFDQMALLPPPLKVPSGTYNMWSGFAVQRYAPPADRPVNTDSEAVRAYLELFDMLCLHNPATLNYLLNWMAHMFQQPARKIGKCIVIKGEEGVGKNRATDLMSMMLGKDMFMQTADPATKLYGRFNLSRAGKFLIVVNEASGGDNFPAINSIKDMVTCDTFECEGKGSNVVTMACYARFIYTTNNDNCMKVESGSRRFVVIEASSERKGHTDYWNRLSSFIDDEHGRYEFYKLLMSRDVSNWDHNEIPVTKYQKEMIVMNLPFEYKFIKHIALKQYIQMQNGKRENVLRVGSNELFTDFLAWMQEIQAREKYDKNGVKFGQEVTKLVWCPERSHGSFKSVNKKHTRAGVVYVLDVPLMVKEMAEKKWLLDDEMPCSFLCGE